MIILYTFTDIDGRTYKRRARRHTPRRIFPKFPESIDYVELLPIEADKTRWWLQDNNLWSTSDEVEKVDIYNDDDSAQTKEMSVYPIYDNPDVPVEKRAISYYIGFDANIYIPTDDGLELFDADDPEVTPESEYIVERLRGIRGE